jgi:diguanylate cyclase (GGDEF)-like protein
MQTHSDLARITDADLALELVNKFHFAVGIWRIESDDPESIILEAVNPVSVIQERGIIEAIGRPILESFPALRGTVMMDKAVEAWASGHIGVLDGLQNGDTWYKVSFIPVGQDRVALLYENVTAEHQQRLQLERMALQDPLTGTLNRRGLLQALDSSFARAERDDSSTALLFFDLDGFKAVNDTYGHEAGDRLLKDVADAIRKVLRGGDTLARLGGDEFAVVCERVTSEEIASLVADKILELMDNSWNIGDGVSVRVGVSVGAAISQGREMDAYTLLRKADCAMYEAKRAGGQQYRLSVPPLEN